MLSAESAHVRKRLITSLYKNSAEGGVAPIWGGQGSWDSINTYKIQVKFTGSRCVLSEDAKEKHYARFEGSSNYSWWDPKGTTRNLSKSLERKIEVKVSWSRCLLSEDVEEKNMQGSKVLDSNCTIVEEIASVNEIADRQTHTRMNRKPDTCRTMPACATKIAFAEKKIA